MAGPGHLAARALGKPFDSSTQTESALRCCPALLPCPLSTSLALGPQCTYRNAWVTQRQLHCKTQTFKSKEYSKENSKVRGTSRFEGIFPSNCRLRRRSNVYSKEKILRFDGFRKPSSIRRIFPSIRRFEFCSVESATPLLGKNKRGFVAVCHFKMLARSGFKCPSISDGHFFF